jgi:hypothetical protein
MLPNQRARPRNPDYHPPVPSARLPADGRGSIPPHTASHAVRPKNVPSAKPIEGGPPLAVHADAPLGSEHTPEYWRAYDSFQSLKRHLIELRKEGASGMDGLRAHWEHRRKQIFTRKQRLAVVSQQLQGEVQAAETELHRLLQSQVSLQQQQRQLTDSCTELERSVTVLRAKADRVEAKIDGAARLRNAEAEERLRLVQRKRTAEQLIPELTEEILRLTQELRQTEISIGITEADIKQSQSDREVLLAASTKHRHVVAEATHALDRVGALKEDLSRLKAEYAENEVVLRRITADSQDATSFIMNLINGDDIRIARGKAAVDSSSTASVVRELITENNELKELLNVTRRAVAAESDQLASFASMLKERLAIFESNLATTARKQESLEIEIKRLQLFPSSAV